jgi:hypothetical protein
VETKEVSSPIILKKKKIRFWFCYFIKVNFKKKIRKFLFFPKKHIFLIKWEFFFLKKIKENIVSKKKNRYIRKKKKMFYGKIEIF